MKRAIIIIGGIFFLMTQTAPAYCWPWDKKKESAQPAVEEKAAQGKGSAAATVTKPAVKADVKKDAKKEEAAAEAQAKEAAVARKARRELIEKKRAEIDNTEWTVQMVPIAGK